MSRFPCKPFQLLVTVFLAAVLLLGPTPSAAGESVVPAVSGTVPGVSGAFSSPVCFAFEWEWKSILGNRRRMMQVALVAVGIGIAILLKGKHG